MSLLSLSALAVKVIGLLYRVPLMNALGSEGMGYFNTAYELYALFCVLSTAGLPVASSVMIARCGDRAGRRRIFRVSFAAFCAVGLIASPLLFLCARPLAEALGNPSAEAAVRAVAPTVFFICISSAFRGYAQGESRMAPTAVSQVIEALGKLILGLSLAMLARRRGADLPVTAAWAAAGLPIGTAVSAAWLAVSHARHAARPTLPGVSASAETASSREILRALLSTAIPVTVSAGAVSLSKLLDVGLILHRLRDAGMEPAAASALYGCYSTLALPVWGILPSLTTSVSLPAVPALSAAYGRLTAARASGDVSGCAGAEKELAVTAERSLGLTAILSIPAGLGLCVFSRDVLSLLFPAQPEAVALAAPWLSVLGLSVPAACLITVSGAMLQAVGHPARPVVSMLAGTLVKAGLAYLLLGIPSVGLIGAPAAACVCDSIILALNLSSLLRVCPEAVPSPRAWGRIILLPAGAASAAVCLVQMLRYRLPLRALPAVSTLLTIAAVACLYAVGLIVPLLIMNNHLRKEET